jgi:hypothetical protein
MYVSRDGELLQFVDHFRSISDSSRVQCDYGLSYFDVVFVRVAEQEEPAWFIIQLLDVYTSRVMQPFISRVRDKAYFVGVFSGEIDYIFQVFFVHKWVRLVGLSKRVKRSGRCLSWEHLCARCLEASEGCVPRGDRTAICSDSEIVPVLDR